MPILDVQIVGEISEPIKGGLAQRLADAAGHALGSGKNGTWVKVQFLDSGSYAENGGVSCDVLPVFVHVIQRELPTGERLASQTAALAGAVATACGRPEENTHVVYEPEGRGRVAFGGKDWA